MTRIILRALNGPILVLLIAVGIAIQSSLFTSWPLLYFQPDIVLLTVIWCALRRNFEEGGIITLIIADICELHSASPQGYYLMTYMAVYLLLRAASRFLVLPSILSYSMVTIACSISFKLVGLFLLYLLGGSGNQWRHTLTFLFLGAAVEGTFSVWFYPWLDKLDWVTYKHARSEHLEEDEIQLDSKGF